MAAKAPPLLKAERYRLTVSGIVTYTPDDFGLRDLFMSDEHPKAKLAEALQELEEEAVDQTITIQRIS